MQVQQGAVHVQQHCVDAIPVNHAGSSGLVAAGEVMVVDVIMPLFSVYGSARGRRTERVVYWCKLATEMDVLDLQSFVAPLLQLCREAGDVICEHYNAPGADQ